MSSTLITVADAMITAIATGSFGVPLTVERKYYFVRDRGDGDTGIYVSLICAAPRRRERITRKHSNEVLLIDVVVERKLPAASTLSDYDDLMDLTEAIADSIDGSTFAELAVCGKITPAAEYSIEHASDDKFVAAFTAELTTVRAIS